VEIKFFNDKALLISLSIKIQIILGKDSCHRKMDVQFIPLKSMMGKVHHRVSTIPTPLEFLRGMF